jgi:hypothetical protein
MYDLSFSKPSEIESEVQKIIRDQKCVIFVGAGLSKPPSEDWSHAVKEIAKDCGVNYREGKEKEVIDECIEGNLERYEKIFREKFRKDNVALRTAYSHLIKLDFKAWITTNFDPWIHNQTQGSPIKKCVKYPNFSVNYISKKEGSCLFYLHGYFDSDDNECFAKDMVFGKKSFEEAYGPNSLLPGFLLNLLTYENVLFVGFNPCEEYIKDLIERSNRIRKKIGSQIGIILRNKRYIMLAECKSNDELKIEEWRLKIEEFKTLELIPYIYDPIDEKDHRGLEPVFRNWVLQIIGPPAPFKTGLDQ